MHEGEGEIARLRAALIDYLKHHASAADTLDGIMDWWLPPEQRTADPKVVEEVLTSLVAEGVASVSALVDGRVLYRRAMNS